MYKKIIITFLVSWGLFFLFFQAFFKSQKERQQRLDSRQTAILLENVKDRFKLFLDLPLSIGIIGADYLAGENLFQKDYDKLFKKILTLNKDILGINLVDATGKIIKVMPEKTNPGTEGKHTQNFNSLINSYKQGEHFWLSSPFKLFQGQQGFVVYVPIEKDSIIQGWLAAVLSTEGFVQKFKATKFLASYDLIIKDQETGIPYFATGVSPDPSFKIYESHLSLHGRHLIFESWRKEAANHYPFNWNWSLFLSLTLALACGFTMKLHEQKKHVRLQLDDISTLLGLTAKEAINNFIEVQSENKDPSFNNISYLTNLIEQIDLLQTMAQTRSGPDVSKLNFLELLKKQIEKLDDIIQKKALRVNFNEADLGLVYLVANDRLLQNSVLSNILGHAIIFARPGSTIQINYQSSEEKHFITFHALKIADKDLDKKSITFDRRMEVARKVLQIYQGELYIQNDLTEGMIVRMILPA